MRQHNKGYTLVEVVIAMMIIAILASVATISVVGYLSKSEQQKYENMAEQFDNAVEKANDNFFIQSFLNKYDCMYYVMLTPDGIYIASLENSSTFANTRTRTMTSEEKDLWDELMASYKKLYSKIYFNGTSEDGWSVYAITLNGLVDYRTWSDAELAYIGETFGDTKTMLSLVGYRIE